MEYLNLAYDFIVNHVMALSGTIAGILEFVLRLLPTQKPLSILWLIHDFLGALLKLLGAVNDLLDKVLPQKLAPVPAAPSLPAEHGLDAK